MFIKHNKNIQYEKFNIQKAQKIIDKKLNIQYYSNEIYLETKKQIKEILISFNDIDLKNIFTSFDIECNLWLNIIVVKNNQEYKLTKQLKYWSKNDLSMLFDFSIENDNNIVLNKYKHTTLKKVILPKFIYDKEIEFKISKIKTSTFIHEMEEIDFSNNDFIELEQNWIQHNINKLIINLNDNNINSISRINITEIWINDLLITNNIILNINNIYVNNQIDNKQLIKLINKFSLFSILNNNQVSICFSYQNNNEIIVNSISSKKELEIYHLFDFLFINNKTLKINKWTKNALSKLKAKTIDASRIIIANDAMFENNNYVEEIILNTYQKIIPKNCFKNCQKLSYINNSLGVQFIYNYAFDNCINLKYFYINKDIKFIDRLAFTNIDSNNTKIIYHKDKSQIVRNIIYQDALEEIIDINELAKICTFILRNNFIEIISFNNNNQILSSSLVEYNNHIFKIKKINYEFKEFTKNNIDIIVPTFTEFVNFNEINFKINKLVFPKWFKLRNIINYPKTLINTLILPLDTAGLKLKNYCNIVVFKQYTNVFNFDYDDNLISLFQWELPIINKQYINNVKLNKWSKSFKEAKIEVINKFKNDFLVPFLIELNHHLENIKVTNI